LTKPKQGKGLVGPPYCFVDGEGANRDDGSQDYVVLCAYSDWFGERILRHEDNSRLTTVEILLWLLALNKESRDAGVPHTFVGFGLRYDVSMWLKDIDRWSSARLASPERYGWYDAKGIPQWVSWAGFSLRQLGSDFACITSQHGWNRRYDKMSFSVWDVWKFYQGSFVDSLRKWKVLPEHELEAMQEMKDKRPYFTTDEYARDADSIINYCLDECRAGVKLVQLLWDTTQDLDYPLKRLDGAGSLAAAMLKAWGVLEYADDPPEYLKNAIACAYHAGRFEVGWYGRIRKQTWQYDLRSAYPTAMQTLPCLKHAEWYATTEVITDGVYECEWELPSPCYWGALPYRHKDGAISYPRRGSGWVWGAEVLAARRLYPDSITIRQGWALARKCDHVPFASVPSVYLQRLYLGKSAQGIVLKLGLNSLYGKTAQTVGKPKYANYVWAGMITSHCRAAILDAIREAGPEHVIAIATDAVVTDAPVGLPLSDRLGDWEETTQTDGLLIIQPGMTIAYSQDEISYKSRGFGKKEFSKTAHQAEQLWEWFGISASLRIHTQRFYTHKTALQRNDYELRCRWKRESIDVAFRPNENKRAVPDDAKCAHIYNRPAITFAVEGGYDSASWPYKKIKEQLESEDVYEEEEVFEGV
jgi:hypothetical protein